MFFLGWYSGWNRVINVVLIKFNVTDELFDRLFDKSRRIGLSKRTRTNYPSLRIFDFSSNFFTGGDRRWRRRRSKTSYTNIIDYNSIQKWTRIFSLIFLFSFNSIRISVRPEIFNSWEANTEKKLRADLF